MHLVAAKETEESTGLGPEARDAPLFVVQTEVFDGPLDLLLHLVKRDGISLARVSISAIADSYLSYLDRMRALDLAIAADWLVMAATLCHLKALELEAHPVALNLHALRLGLTSKAVRLLACANDGRERGFLVLFALHAPQLEIAVGHADAIAASHEEREHDHRVHAARNGQQDEILRSCQLVAADVALEIVQ